MPGTAVSVSLAAAGGLCETTVDRASATRSAWRMRYCRTSRRTPVINRATPAVHMHPIDRVLSEVDRAEDEIVAFARAGIRLAGTLEISGTVDEESGGFAGVAWLAEQGRIARGRTDFVIIPEPLNVDRICIGHRGVYWFELTARGRIAHGSMPFLGVSAIDAVARVVEAVRRELAPRLAERITAMPVVPEAARRA